MKTLSLVIPVFNEEKRLDEAFRQLEEFMCPKGFKLSQVIFVDDGSQDKSKKLILDFIRTRTCYKLISYSPNRGKGYAVRLGCNNSQSDYTLVADADMSTSLSQISRFEKHMRMGIDAIVGTRRNGVSTVIVHQPVYREFLGNCFTILTRILLNTPVSDFTCGFKAFSKKAKDEIFTKSIIDRWGFDAEILFLARKMNFLMVEQTVLWANSAGSKVVLYKAIPQTIIELFKIRIHHGCNSCQSAGVFQPSVTPQS